MEGAGSSENRESLEKPSLPILPSTVNLSLLLILGCHNKIPQKEWLNKQKLLSHSSGG